MSHTSHPETHTGTRPGTRRRAPAPSREGKLVGVYVYGAAAFPDSGPTGDIDFHVILAEPLTDPERDAILALHAALARDFPPLGAELDGRRSSGRGTPAARNRPSTSCCRRSPTSPGHCTASTYAPAAASSCTARPPDLYPPAGGTGERPVWRTEIRGSESGAVPRLLHPQPLPADVQLCNPRRRHLQDGRGRLGPSRFSPLAAPHRAGATVRGPGDPTGAGIHAIGSGGTVSLCHRTH